MDDHGRKNQNEPVRGALFAQKRIFYNDHDWTSHGCALVVGHT